MSREARRSGRAAEPKCFGVPDGAVGAESPGAAGETMGLG